MTFYEAALRVLEGAGTPLHFQEITERSIAGNLLSHVGKTPEQTMLSRLLAMARRPRDRRVVVTAKDTFGLVEWPFPEDPEALAATAAEHEKPEEALPPYRPAERHPEPRQENVRTAGRGSSGKHRRDEEEPRKKRRFPPIPEVVFEILSEAGEPLPPPEVGERARSKELAASDLGTEQILTALLEDNQRRIDGGRRPQFVFKDGELLLESAASPSNVPAAELQAAFANVLGIPMENGRPVLPRAAAAQRAEVTVDPQAFATAKSAVRDARRASARAVRQRLEALEFGTFEKSVIRMMQALGFRELKVAKRAKEGPLVTARKREGSLELRYAVRILKGAGQLERRAVQDLRKDLGHHAAHVGVIVSCGEPRGDARSDATGQGALVLLWCGEGLADKFLEARAGVKVTTVELFELDERFFEEARSDAEESARRREERKEQKQQREGGRERQGREAERPSRQTHDTAAASEQESRADEETEKEPRVSAAGPAPEPGAQLAPEEARAESEESDEDDDDAEGGTAEGAAAEGAAGGSDGAGRRRRRRRRGRRGRGARPEEGSAAAAPGEGAPTEGAEVTSTEAAAPAESPVPAPVEVAPAGGAD